MASSPDHHITPVPVHAFSNVHDENGLNPIQVPLTGFPQTRECLTKAEVTMTGVDENWLAGQLAGVLNLGEEEAGKERKAGSGTTDDGQKNFTFYAREQRADGG